MDSLSSIFGAGGGLVGILLAILALFVFGFLIYRMINQPVFGSARRNKQARLAVTDAITFGKKHKLLLLRRDDIEHLVLIGGPTDIVVESNIRRTAAVRPRETSSSEIETAVVAASATASSDSNKDLVNTPELKKETPAPAKLRPVANETPPAQARPQFVPRQEPGDQPKPAMPDQRAATALATPRVQPVTKTPESPFSDQPAARAAPVPPAKSPPAKSPAREAAVVGGVVAAPIVASTSENKPVQQQESPFKDPVPETVPSSPSALPEKLSVVEPAAPPASEGTTLAPRSKVENAADNQTTGSGSVADDMDALLKELGAKR